MTSTMSQICKSHLQNTKAKDNFKFTVIENREILIKMPKTLCFQLLLYFSLYQLTDYSLQH